MRFLSKIFNISKKKRIDTEIEDNIDNSIPMELFYSIENFPKDYTKIVCSKNGQYVAVFQKTNPNNSEYLSELTLLKLDINKRKFDVIFKELFKTNAKYSLLSFDLSNNYLVYTHYSKIKVLDINKLKLQELKCDINMLNYIKISNINDILVVLHNDTLDFYNLKESKLNQSINLYTSDLNKEMLFTYNDDYFILNDLRKIYIFKLDTFVTVNEIKVESASGLFAGNTSNIITGSIKGKKLFLYDLDKNNFVNIENECPEDEALYILYNGNRTTKQLYFSARDNYIVCHGAYMSKYSNKRPVKNILVFDISNYDKIKLISHIELPGYSHEIMWSNLDENNDLIVISEITFSNKTATYIYKVNGSWISEPKKIEPFGTIDDKISSCIDNNTIMARNFYFNDNTCFSGIINLSRELISQLEAGSISTDSIGNNDTDVYY